MSRPEVEHIGLPKRCRKTLRVCTYVLVVDGSVESWFCSCCADGLVSKALGLARQLR